MRVDTEFYRSGEPGRIHLGIPWMPGVWEDRAEFQLRDLPTFVASFTERLINTERFEIAIFEVSGNGAETICAAAVVAFDNDPHVGLTLSVEVAFSAIPGLGKVLMREFHRVARNGGAKTIRVIKRIGAYNYNVRYVQVKE